MSYAPAYRARNAARAKIKRGISAFDLLPKAPSPVSKTQGLYGKSVAWSTEHLACRDRIFPVLDDALTKYASGNIGNFAQELMRLLDDIKVSFPLDDWYDVAVPVIRTHDLQRVVHECAFTAHSYKRPRGYPGDADLLDLVYRHPNAQPIIDGLTQTGRAIFDVTTGVMASEAVKDRRHVVARKIDEVAARRPGVEILAVACGHLRELEFSEAAKAGALTRFVATDQDGRSLAEAQKYAVSLTEAVETQELSVKDFISSSHNVGTFDLVYAAGLYDYLDARIAMRLTRKLFELLKPGGTLLVPNLLTGIREVAYMETCMDWFMIYRNEAEIKAFAGEISELDMASLHYYEDSSSSIGYLEIERS